MPPPEDPPTPTPKEPYVRPEVVKVPLRPKEAVLGFCKTDSSAGPGSGMDCTTCGSLGT